MYIANTTKPLETGALFVLSIYYEGMVYTFSVRLCDNGIDRDFERFDLEGLNRLSELFMGKSGIFDHQWSAKGQKTRIYKTQVVEDTSVSSGSKEPYAYLKGWAYMLRSPGNEELIGEIEAGIKKEVSVGCAVARTVCSVCGKDLGACDHKKGALYDTEVCHGILKDPVDAYEWSFVAVPAQQNAGIMKAYQKEEKAMQLKQWVQKEHPEFEAQMDNLEKDAKMGRRYLKSLRDEVLRLCALAGEDLTSGTMEAVLEKLAEEELLEFKKTYEKKVARLFPPKPQLPGTKQAMREEEFGSYLV